MSKNMGHKFNNSSRYRGLMAHMVTHVRVMGMDSHHYHKLMIGVVWGSIAGSIIGVGISLTVGLLFMSAALLITLVIITAGILGAIFGFIMTSILLEEGAGTIASEQIHNAPHHRETISESSHDLLSKNPYGNSGNNAKADMVYNYKSNDYKTNRFYAQPYIFDVASKNTQASVSGWNN